MPTARFIALALGLSLAAAVKAQGQPPVGLAIAAAADLQSVLPAIADRFERDTSGRVTLTFGSSGNFFAQIQNGAPFDLFFSADMGYPRQLEAAGLTEPGTLRPYAIGTLVLYAGASGGLDLGRGLAALTDARVRRIAIANPAHAPYGRAAVAALTHERIYDRVRGKLVLGENVSQAAQFVQSGNAQAGLLALSLALAPALRKTGSFIEVPASFYPPIEQAAVVLKASSRKDAARQFLAYLGRPEIVRQMKDAGFLEPRPVAVR
jgi:molybdate transport system substrate-binding protein